VYKRVLQVLRELDEADKAWLSMLLHRTLIHTQHLRRMRWMRTPPSNEDERTAYKHFRSLNFAMHTNCQNTPDQNYKCIENMHTNNFDAQKIKNKLSICHTTMMARTQRLATVAEQVLSIVVIGRTSMRTAVVASLAWTQHKHTMHYTVCIKTQKTRINFYAYPHSIELSNPHSLASWFA
jgi:hypothetical protein